VVAAAAPAEVVLVEVRASALLRASEPVRNTPLQGAGHPWHRRLCPCLPRI
jgi:hypothetical protein